MASKLPSRLVQPSKDDASQADDAEGGNNTVINRLALPAASKRRRDGSLDLETGLEPKKSRNAPEPASNLTKSKSKSMMNIAGRPASAALNSRGGTRPGVSAPKSRVPPALNRVPPTTGRASIAAVGRPLNDRTNRSMGTGSKGGVAPPGKPGGKRPAWDVKGRMEDMEKKFEESSKRLEALEAEKQELQEDVEVKHEVVVKSSEEIRVLQSKIEESDSLLSSLKKSLAEKEDKFAAETLKLKRALEEEEFNKASLQRKLTALEGELSAKQTEVMGLKTSVAELSSSRAAVEASLSGTKHELEAARAQVAALSNENNEKKKLIEEGVAREEAQAGKLRWEESERRRLHNIIQELKGNIRVFCRLRPLLGAEKEGGEDINHVNIQDEKNLELFKSQQSGAGGANKDLRYDFEFDRVFGPKAGQAEVFAELSQLVQSALDGYNVCVFAYGQTGSGKTFTMEGGEGGDEEVQGMIPRTIKQIFEAQQRLKEKNWEYKLQASFLEIYNEEIRDLLAVEKDLKYEVKMTDPKGSDLVVTNLRTEEVVNEAHVESMMRRAGKTRAQAKTLCNERSSRSHSVFILKIEGHNTSTLETCCGVLNLVDLAGSERIKESGSEGVRLTEAQAINKSLSNLGQVIMALSQKASHVPYRNSKLTHLLQNSLGGNSKTLMFVNISPKEECFAETLNSLRFATKVNQCNIGTATKKIK